MPREKETSKIRSLGNGDKPSVPVDSAGTRERPEMPIAAPSSSMQAAENVPPRIFSEDLREMAVRAKFNKYIPIDALIRIMAQEEAYTREVYASILPVLWDKYHMHRIWKKEEIRIATFGNRYEIWQALLNRWTGIQGDQRDFNPPYLILYRHNAQGDTYEKTGNQKAAGLPCIRVDEFKAYMDSMREIYGITLPLPQRLFGGEDPEDENEFIPGKSVPGDRSSVTDAGDAKEVAPANMFRKRGQIWEIAFEGGIVFFLKDYRGLQYIHFLLGRPGDPISSMDLARMGLAESSAIRIMEPGMRIRRLNTPLRNKPGGLTQREKWQDDYENRLEEIQQEMENEPNPQRKLELKEQYTLLYEELNQGKPVRQRTQHGNARAAVRKGIKEAIDRVREISSPLAGYLEKTISTGNLCIYRPLAEKPIEWAF